MSEKEKQYICVKDSLGYIIGEVLSLDSPTNNLRMKIYVGSANGTWRKWDDIGNIMNIDMTDKDRCTAYKLYSQEEFAEKFFDVLL